MYHKELSVCVSASTTASLFSLITEIEKCRAQMPSHLLDSAETVVKSKYKSPFYKLWQYATKNKPSPYNDGVVHYNNTSCPQIQRIFTSYKGSFKFFLQLQNCIKQATSIEFQRSLLHKIGVFFHDSNNIGWCNALCSIPRIDLVCWIFTYIRNILRKEQNNNRKEYFKLNSLALQICKIKRQRERALHRIGICINNILRNKVHC